MAHKFSASIWKEDDGYVAQCIEIDIASQGDTEAEALANLREAVDLFFECAPPEEVTERYHPEIQVAQFEIAHG
ncbi:MAG: type II toxin-antitoxin system HicB family antitoxin [Candidatus Hydrogenedentes bacterium]|nr:type II toxin-antitoxin system HicB family antitoxin [Candidatus Hydrogenedentota bacterium]